MTRFIVRTQDLNKKRIYWKNGISHSQCGNRGQSVAIKELPGDVELPVPREDLRINNRFKQFLLDRFSSEAAFDTLCRDMKFEAQSFAGDFDLRITHFIQHLELRRPNPVRALRTALLKLRPEFMEDIQNL